MKRNKYVEKVVGNYQGPEKERKKKERLLFLLVDRVIQSRAGDLCDPSARVSRGSSTRD